MNDFQNMDDVDVSITEAALHRRDLRFTADSIKLWNAVSRFEELTKDINFPRLPSEQRMAVVEEMNGYKEKHDRLRMEDGEIQRGYDAINKKRPTSLWVHRNDCKYLINVLHCNPGKAPGNGTDALLEAYGIHRALRFRFEGK